MVHRIASRFLQAQGAVDFYVFIAHPDARKAFQQALTQAHTQSHGDEEESQAILTKDAFEVVDHPPMPKLQAQRLAEGEIHTVHTSDDAQALAVGSDGQVKGWLFYGWG